MIPLIDGDILCYEIGYAAETGWKKELENGLPTTPPFDYVKKLLHLRIDEICYAVKATAPPRIFLTGEGNFRDKIATVKPYKGTRDENKKPFHYKNIRVHLKAVYETEVVDGIEADDKMAIEQTKFLRNGCDSTIICSRDKDLRQVPGWHYGWELGRQPEFGPYFVEEEGYLELVNRRIKGVGLPFFYAQCIMGDSTDNIPGLPKRGDVYAFKCLSELPASQMLEAVRREYRAIYGDRGDEMLLEQGRLLWMVRDLQKGQPTMWSF